MANYHRNTLILTAEPFVGFMPVDLYAWVNEHSSDRDIAVALAEVHNHVGILGHDLDEVDDQWLIYTYEAWWEIEKRLYELMLASLRLSSPDYIGVLNLSWRKTVSRTETDGGYMQKRMGL